MAIALSNGRDFEPRHYALKSRRGSISDAMLKEYHRSHLRIKSPDSKARPLRMWNGILYVYCLQCQYQLIWESLDVTCGTSILNHLKHTESELTPWNPSKADNLSVNPWSYFLLCLSTSPHSPWAPQRSSSLLRSSSARLSFRPVAVSFPGNLFKLRTRHQQRGTVDRQNPATVGHGWNIYLPYPLVQE